MTKKEITTYDCTDMVKKVFSKMKTLKEKEIETPFGKFCASEDLKQAIKELKDKLTPELFHNLYEKYARISGWETHKNCINKTFDELPETNQEAMILTLDAIHKAIDKIMGVWEDDN